MMTASVTGNRGVATSLIEAVLVIGIVAVITGMALTAAMDRLEDARVSRAMADAEMIGISIHSFMHDTGFAPAFKSGDALGPDAEIFSVLASGGSKPGMDASLNWPTEDEEYERLENQLIRNRPGYSEETEESGEPYPRIGQISHARFKGWNGPYVARMPTSDPWDNKYLVNVQLLTAKGVQMAQPVLTLGVGQRAAVFVVSAGADRQLDTRFDQIADAFTAGGDDIVYRIQ
jgi:type II secretory pathway pseudopilin PulG